MNEAIKRQTNAPKTINLPIRFLVIVLFSGSCTKESISVREQMIFLGHIYQPGFENRIDFRLEGVGFHLYDQVLLGGDLCVETTKEQATVSYLDSIFDLSAETTLWSVGNHDLRNGHFDYITTATGRPFTYLAEKNGIRYINLNTNYTADQCEELEQQFLILEDGLQNLDGIKNIIVLSHHAIWTEYAMSLDEPFAANARHSVWRAHCRDDKNNFSDAVVPLLDTVADQGTLVLWIAGDFGQKKSTYQFMARPNVYFLGNGLDINKQDNRDSVLIIDHEENNALTWKFIPIEDLPQ
jgi:hypothetical protein